MHLSCGTDEPIKMWTSKSAKVFKNVKKLLLITDSENTNLTFAYFSLT